jgi:hypothetical protein
MPFHFNFSAAQILWTLILAALLVLLTVLYGRDRARRFPWFTASIVLAAILRLVGRILYERMAPIPANVVILSLADLSAVVSLLVLMELGRRGFQGASRRTLAAWTMILLAAGIAVVAYWGPWPSRQTLGAASLLAVLQLMNLAAQRIELLASLLALAVGVLVLLFGRRYRAGWRSHTQKIVIGLSTVGISQVAVRGIWQAIATHATVHSRAEYDNVMALQTKLYNANNVVYLAVLVWWIAWLWMDESGTPEEKSLAGQAPIAEVAASDGTGEPAPEE